jgi:hypothetical protein
LARADFITGVYQCLLEDTGYEVAYPPPVVAEGKGSLLMPYADAADFGTSGVIGMNLAGPNTQNSETTTYLFFMTSTKIARTDLYKVETHGLGGGNPNEAAHATHAVVYDHVVLVVVTGPNRMMPQVTACLAAGYKRITKPATPQMAGLAPTAAGGVPALTAAQTREVQLATEVPGYCPIGTATAGTGRLANMQTNAQATAAVNALTSLLHSRADVTVTHLDEDATPRMVAQQIVNAFQQYYAEPGSCYPQEGLGTFKAAVAALNTAAQTAPE